MKISITEDEWWAIQICIGEIHVETDHNELIDREKIRVAYMKIDEIMSRAIK